MTHTGVSAFDEVNEKVAQAGEILGLKPGVISALSSYEREVVISIPLRRGDDVEVLEPAELKELMPDTLFSWPALP